MKNILILFLLFYPLLLSGQIGAKKFSLSGQVKVIVDNDTAAPVHRPIVRVSGTQLGVLADSLGNYRINGLSSNHIKINMMGFGYSADTIVEIADRSVDGFIILAKTDCSVNRTAAERDIRLGTVRLLLTTGLVPDSRTAYDSEFERLYKVQYFDYGFLSPALECVFQYNRRIAEHLDKQYGNEWRSKVRKDVRGL